MSLFPDTWKFAEAREICSQIVDCVNKTAPVVDYETPYKMIRTTNVKNGRIDLSGARCVDEATFIKWNRRLTPRKGDVVLTREAPLGDVGLIRTDDKVFLGQRTMIFRADGINLDQRFLYYSLLGPTLQAQISALGSGSTVEHVRVPDAERLVIPHPPIGEQKKIAGLLSAYDDLIENNKRRITLLENMAEEIYREWFVRFRFPGWQEAEFEKGLPASWAVAQGDDLFEVVKGKSYSSEEISDHLNGGRPFINLKNFNRGGGYRCNGLKYFRGEFRDRQQVNRGDVVMAVTDMTQNREVIGRAARVPYLGETDGVISLDVVKISAFSWPDLFTYAHLRYSGISEALKELANGANVLHLKPDLIGKQKYLVPDTPIVEEFVKLVEPFYEQIEKLEQQIDMLEYTKNQLLPRLISGKLSVENLDIQFPPSMQSDGSDSADEAAA